MAAGLLLVTLGCGGGEDDARVASQLISDADRAAPDPNVDPSVAGRAITAFGDELFRAAVEADTEGGNVIVSPASVAFALAMIEPGAVGAGRTELRELLHVDDPATFHASMNAFEQELEGRVLDAPFDASEDPGELIARIADAAFLQEGYPFEPDYLETIGRHYGPVIRELDYSADPDAAAHEINELVADATEERIPELIADGVLSEDVVLTLVNALYLKASWQTTFDEAETHDADFTRLDGSEVTVPLMEGEAGATARGDRWIGASKPYVGGLQVQFVLPDDGRFAEVAANLPEAFAAFESRPTGPARLAVPRFEVRHQQELSPTLRSLGLEAPYHEGNLLGIADDPRLVLDSVIHETYLAMDEEGTEAAAATAAVFIPVSAPIEPPGPVVLDRPFLFRIYDSSTGATLFLGQVLDPSA